MPKPGFFGSFRDAVVTPYCNLFTRARLKDAACVVRFQVLKCWARVVFRSKAELHLVIRRHCSVRRFPCRGMAADVTYVDLENEKIISRELQQCCVVHSCEAPPMDNFFEREEFFLE